MGKGPLEQKESGVQTKLPLVCLLMFYEVDWCKPIMHPRNNGADGQRLEGPSSMPIEICHISTARLVGRRLKEAAVQDHEGNSSSILAGPCE